MLDKTLCHGARTNKFEALNNIYVEMKNWDQATSPAKIAELGRKHCILYAELSSEQIRLHSAAAWRFWRLYPKHHMFIHIVEEQTTETGNPSSNWCYMDEDSIGLCADYAEGGNAEISSSLYLREVPFVRLQIGMHHGVYARPIERKRSS